MSDPDPLSAQSNEPQIHLSSDKIPLGQKSAYAIGMLVNNLQAAAIPALMVILNLGLKIDARWVGIIGAVPRLFDAISDPMMGYISDNTRSRWGRRRPYIFVGALIAGVIFALMWQLPPGYSKSFYIWTFLSASILYFLAYTVYATPFVAFGFEMTSDYHERTRLHTFANTVGQLPWLAVPWFYWLMSSKYFDDQVQGARFIALWVGGAICLLGIIPAIFCREKNVLSNLEDADKDASPKASFLSSMVEFMAGLFASFKCKPFVKLCAATFLVFNGYQLGVGITIYVLQFYIYNSDAATAGKLYGTYFTTVSICTLVVIPLTGWLATKFGKRETFMIAIPLSLLGYLLKWFFYSPSNPYLLLASCPFIAFGTGSLFTLMASMVSDVCDYDELSSSERREGMFAAIYWWMVKVGMAIATLLGGYLLHAAGFDEELKMQSTETMFWLRIFDVGVPLITSALALLIMSTYEISESRAKEIRTELEQRRQAR